MSRESTMKVTIIVNFLGVTNRLYRILFGMYFVLAHTSPL